MENYFQYITRYFQGIDGALPKELFSDKVREDVRKTREEFDKTNSVFVFDAGQIIPVVTKKETVEIITYTGTFTYGFVTNGIFHTIPGDLSSQTIQQPNEQGTVQLVFDVQRRQVVRISESLSGNTYGDAVAVQGGTSPLRKTLRYIGIGILFFIFVFQLTRVNMNLLSSIDNVSEQAQKSDMNISLMYVPAMHVPLGVVLPTSWTDGYDLTLYSPEDSVLREEDAFIERRGKWGTFINDTMPAVPLTGVGFLTRDSAEAFHAKNKDCDDRDRICRPYITPADMYHEQELLQYAAETRLIGGVRYLLRHRDVDGDSGVLSSYIRYVDGIRVEFQFLTERKTTRLDAYVEQMGVTGSCDTCDATMSWL